MENSTEETAEYAPLLDQRYLVLIGQRKVADAEEYISEQLRVCVDEGEIHALADLYAHRAVWRMQLGKLRAAAKDLQAALKARISGQAVVEVRALLAQCYRDTGRPDEAAEEEKQALKDAVTGSHLPVLAVKQLLSESKAKATREESTTEMVSAKPQQNSAGAASASNGSTATEVPSRKQRQRGSMGGGFLTKADTLTTANSVSSGPCTSGDLARPVGRAQRAGVIPEGAGRRVEDVDDEEPLAAARPRRGGATITDLDGDELEEVINTPLNLTTDPAAKTRLMALMGPGACLSLLCKIIVFLFFLLFAAVCIHYRCLLFLCRVLPPNECISHAHRFDVHTHAQAPSFTLASFLQPQKGWTMPPCLSCSGCALLSLALLTGKRVSVTSLASCI